MCDAALEQELFLCDTALDEEAWVSDAVLDEACPLGMLTVDGCACRAMNTAVFVTWGNTRIDNPNCSRQVAIVV